jgi:hypothetical protein
MPMEAAIVLVLRVLNVAEVHSWNLMLKGSSHTPVPSNEKSNCVPCDHVEVQGLVAVLQRVVAEAEPAPLNATKAVAITTARPNIFRYFISSSLFGAEALEERTITLEYSL